MIYLFSEDFFWPAKLKNILKQMLGQARGPQAVFSSLCRGLRELGQPFAVNQAAGDMETVCVLSGINTLAWAIEQKKNGRIKKLIAGPNIVVTPLDGGGIMQNPAVDLVVCPSQWVVDWWKSLAPQLSGKLRAWPAGVADTGMLRKNNGTILVFKKQVPADILETVTKTLESLNLPYQVFQYGQKGTDYKFRLKQTNFLIYLNTSESQGLALQEAWIAGIPTMVWNRGFVSYGPLRWEDPAAAAPYLTPAAGVYFADDFPEKLKFFLQHLQQFTPRQYVLENLTDAKSAEKYLNLCR